MTAQTVYLAIGSAFSNGVLTELSGNGYARASTSATFDNVSTNFYVQGAEFGPATGTWSAGTYLALFDAATAGNLLFAWPAAVPALNTTSPVSYAVGTFTVDLAITSLAVGATLSTQAAVGSIFGGTFNGAVVYTGNVKVAYSTSGTLAAATGVTAVTYSSSMSLNAAASSYFTVTLTGSGSTIAPTGGVNGQVIMLEITQDGTGSRTVSTWSNVRWASGTAPTLTTTANATDVLRFTYNSVVGKWNGETVGKAFS